MLYYLLVEFKLFQSSFYVQQVKQMEQFMLVLSRLDPWNIVLQYNYGTPYLLCMHYAPCSSSVRVCFHINVLMLNYTLIGAANMIFSGHMYGLCLPAGAHNNYALCTRDAHVYKKRIVNKIIVLGNKSDTPTSTSTLWCCNNFHKK